MASARSPSVPRSPGWARVRGTHVGGKFRSSRSGPALRGVRGNRGQSRPSLRQKGKKRREAEVGGGAGSTDLNRFRLPLRPREARAGRRGPSPPARPGRRSPPPPSANVYLKARAHTESVQHFYPSGEKTGSVKEERAKPRTPPRCALHSVPRLGAGTPLPPARSLPALQRVPVGARARASALGDAGRLLGARADLATAAAGRRDRGDKSPASASPSSAGAPRPAGPRRQAEGEGGGEEAGRAEAPEKLAASGPPAARPWMRRPGSLETTLPCDAPRGLQGPRPRAQQRP